MTKYDLFFLLTFVVFNSEIARAEVPRIRVNARGHKLDHASSQKYLQAHEERLDVIAGSWSNVNLQQHDRILAALDKRLGGTIKEGHSGTAIEERKIYAALGRMSNVRRICEIGFNGGHSASLWLWANPDAEVVMFDIWEHDYSPLGENFLLSDEARSLGIVDAPSRLRIVKGNSLKTVTNFLVANPSTKCDLLSVDGGHTYEIALADIAHMHSLANPRFNTMIVDDTQCALSWCVDAALEEHQRRGTLRKLLSVSLKPYDGTRGLSVGMFLH